MEKREFHSSQIQRTAPFIGARPLIRVFLVKLPSWTPNKPTSFNTGFYPLQIRTKMPIFAGGKVICKKTERLEIPISESFIANIQALLFLSYLLYCIVSNSVKIKNLILWIILFLCLARIVCRRRCARALIFLHLRRRLNILRLNIFHLAEQFLDKRDIL